MQFVHGTYPTRSILMIVGDNNVGKSFALQFLSHVCSSFFLLDWECSTKMRDIWYAYANQLAAIMDIP
jgi:hypothetical protein